MALPFATFAVVATPPASAAPLTCGAVLTISTQLDRDLRDCPGDGLVIGAPGITLDLGGHVVDGTGLGAGVLNNGFDGVTITNGTVQEFEAGVRLAAGTSGGTVSSVTANQNKLAGVELIDADDGTNGNTVESSTLTGNGAGVALLSGTQAAVVRNNTIQRSSGAALLLDSSSGNRLEGNKVDGSGDTGVQLIAASGNTLAGNTVTNSSDSAVWLEQGSNNNILYGNTLGTSQKGIQVQDSDGNELTGNTATTVGEAGIDLSNANDSILKDNNVGSNDGGIRLHFSSRNHLEGNDASGSTSTGIAVGDGSLNNVLVGNTSSNNAARGIVVTLEAPAGSGTLIEANIASGNKDDGIHVAKGGHTIKGNTANNNGKYGIWAAQGNIDGGGNVATGNAEALQCVGVVCNEEPTTPPPSPDPGDTTAPDTAYLSGPVQDTASTVEFTFTGTDHVTAQEHLTYECRLQATDATYQQTDPALAFVACATPWQVPLPEPGFYLLEIRAIDTAGNVDASPAKHTFEVPVDSTTPDTSFTETPADPTTGTSATFAFTGNDPSPSNGSALDFTPAEFLSFECLLDDGVGSPDPTEAWLECASPHTFSNLAPGTHKVEVRAVDGANNIDPTPASYTWTMQGGTSTEPPPPGEPTEADARNVACGEAITASTWVGNDLTDCSGEGLVIGAPNITLNLGGHTIDGALTVAPGQETGLPAGIRNGGHNNVTIKNGTVTGFGYGVRLLGPAAYNVVEAMTLTGNQLAGVELVDADDGTAGNTIRNNTLTGNGGGVSLIEGSQNSVVSGNTMTGNAVHAVLIQDASGHTIADNAISGKMTDPLLGSDAGIMLSAATNNELTGNSVGETGDAGVALRAGSNGNSIVENRIRQTGGSAISVQDSDGNQLLNNVATLAAGTAIELAGNDNTIQGNDLRGNPGGIHAAGADNTVDTNDVTGSTGSGITLESGLGNRITNNLANQTNGVGIAVSVEAVDTAGSPIPGNLIQGNTASGNNGDGIYVARGGHTVTGNTANNNAGYGIYAGEGVIDGGGNVASGNAKVEQCVNVVCTTDGSTPPPSGSDTTPPETTITAGPPATTTETSATFAFSANEDGSTFECSLDGAPFSGCTSEVVYTDLAAGSHVFQVQATDAAGNTDATPASHEWTIGQAACSGGGTVTAGSVADSWIHSKDSGKNFGTDSIMKVATKQGENTRALVQFSLPAVSQGCSLVGAELRLYNASPKGGRTIQVLQLNGPWTERGVTWANQPTTTGTAATATTPSSAAWMQWNVTAQVQAMYDSGSAHGFLVRDALEGGGGEEQQFHSREKSPDRPPELVITFG